jgi:hypothetical protein
MRTSMMGRTYPGRVVRAMDTLEERLSRMTKGNEGFRPAGRAHWQPFNDS